MDELWVRVLMVAVALAAALAISYRLTSPGRIRPRSLETGDLAPGIYLFTSSTCADCVPARHKLTEALGPEGFTEIRWDTQPEVLQKLQVDAVPATLVVDEPGQGVLYPGQPDRVLRLLGP